MTPREQLRKMSAMGEQGALDEKHWYRLVNGMSAGELRQRQEMMMRNQMAMAPQILAQGQQRLQGVPPQFEPRFMERELGPPAEMVSSEARQMHMGGHLVPPMTPHSGMPGRGFPGASYNFLPSEPMETVARRQELIHKQNIARMEMNAILHQKEMENAHQKGLMGMEAPMLYQSNAMAFRGRQRLPEGHDVFVHRTTLEEMQANSLLMSASPYPPISTLQRERGRRAGRRAANHKSTESLVSCPKSQLEDKGVEQSPGGASGEEKETEGKMDMGGEVASKQHQTKVDVELSAGGRKSYKEEQGLRKACMNGQDGCPDVTNCNRGSSDKDMSSQCSAFQYPSASGPIPGMPYIFPPGPPNLFINGEDVSSVEDIRKWTVDDVYNFINNTPSCSEYAQTFKDHMIDGETLPLLTEDHLLDTMGLKLGPALKIRSQVSRRLGSMFYMMNLPLAAASLQAAPEKPGGDRTSEISSPVNCNSVEMMGSPCIRDLDGPKPIDPLPETDNPSPPSASSETA
ncbi:sterile alpha motif domain-containing protein 7 [Esox lucius]|uniref:SAM domain-containing protein n=1 Tax=Esox lucius TaxID=8010 RepID=A0A3P8ZID4_ESOLU|nr:sterile alpha motif domain-containing protein 7 [Esox lucius]XP_019900626.1 sterile alpha motif domain-containing protein 7 [Esox lucius]XP_019900628.1 sterile alpha motif domain-containing protein 7 [Esox lucius]XP_019900630.1 sterile alpha motif domain-containing protein 7 [Esox lucius]